MEIVLADYPPPALAILHRPTLIRNLFFSFYFLRLEQDVLIINRRLSTQRKAIESPERDYVTPTLQNIKVLKEIKPPPRIIINIQDYTIKEALKVISGEHISS
ncbi:hypothetical protein GWI33_005167 [Rhynchophorus ferrugineus]|uniref:Uncharacterized protein n=1 Tax=Rhynchophorus ferrugineus TaxID=354439 RepID=A0A834IHW3_RHYFE|nr:hypothetical protein GWI33_005167 [Rhynchophorus ferrugineus]